MNHWLAGFNPKVNAIWFWFGITGLQHIMPLLSCILLVLLSRRLNPKMRNWCSNMTTGPLFHLLLPPVSTDHSGSLYPLLLPIRHALHGKTDYFFIHKIFLYLCSLYFLHLSQYCSVHPRINANGVRLRCSISFSIYSMENTAVPTWLLH